MHIVKYKICSNIEHKYKLLAPKWDSPQKHVNKRKANKPMKGVKKVSDTLVRIVRMKLFMFPKVGNLFCKK